MELAVTMEMFTSTTKIMFNIPFTTEQLWLPFLRCCSFYRDKEKSPKDENHYTEVLRAVGQDHSQCSHSLVLLPFFPSSVTVNFFLAFLFFTETSMKKINGKFTSGTRAVPKVDTHCYVLLWRNTGRNISSFALYRNKCQRRWRLPANNNHLTLF